MILAIDLHVSHAKWFFYQLDYLWGTEGKNLMIQKIKYWKDYFYYDLNDTFKNVVCFSKNVKV